MPKVLSVLIVCSGLGHVHRGFESFSLELRDALKSEPTLRVRLYGGSPLKDGGDFHVVPCLRRHWKLTRLVAAVTRRGQYQVEQLTFAIGLVPAIRRHRPDVVYFSDLLVGRTLVRLRRRGFINTRLLFCNGGPDLPPYDGFDLVQQVNPTLLQAALKMGVPAEQQRLVPYGVKVPLAGRLDFEARKKSRARLGLDSKRPLILSVAALNNSHKRARYLIDEVAALNGQVTLLLVGSRDAETPAVERFAHERLGNDCVLRAVPLTEMAPYYQAADVFVLASLREGMPRALVEAGFAGLPALVHDYPITRFVLGENGEYGNFNMSGSLTDLLRRAITSWPEPEEVRTARSEAIQRRFGWDVMTGEYVGLLRDAASMPAEARKETLNASAPWLG